MPLSLFLNEFTFFVLVDRISPIGSHRYLSPILWRHNSVGNHDDIWNLVKNVEEFAALVLSAVKADQDDERVKQLRDQIGASRDGIRAIVKLDKKLKEEGRAEKPYANFLASEQQHLFGHTAHPAPKVTRLNFYLYETKRPISGHFFVNTNDILW